MKRTRVILVCAILGSLSARVAILWEARNRYWTTYEVRYDEVARNIAAGRGFAETGVMDLNISELTGAGRFMAPRPPLYPLFLAALYTTAGRDPLVVGGLQSLLSVGTAMLCYLAARRLFGRRAGVLTALIALLYPYHIYHDIWLGDSAMSGLLLMSWLLLAWRLGRDGRGRWAVAVGAILGLAMLLRPAFGLLLVATAIWLRLGAGQHMSRAGKNTLIAGATAACVMLPWIVRNYRVFGALVPVCTYGGYAFWVGNNPITEHCLRTGIEVDQPVHALLSLIGDSLRGLDELQQQQWFYKEGFSFVREYPIAFLRLIPWKVWRFWGWEVYPRPEQSLRDIVHGATYVPLAVLAGVGFMSAYRAKRRNLSLLLAVYACFTVFHFVFYSYTRYRKPLDYTLAIVAGHGFITLVSKWKRGSATLRERSGDPPPPHE